MIKFDVKVESKVYFGSTWYEVVLIVDKDWKVGKAEFKGSKESWKRAFGRAREIAKRKVGWVK